MAREKSEIIEELKSLGAAQAESTLKKKTVDKLEEMVAELKSGVEKVFDEVDVEVQVSTEVVGNITEENVEVEEEEVTEQEDDYEVLSESTHQLGIFTEFIYHVRNEGADVIVMNKGNGDLYVDRKATKVGDKETRLLTGDKRVIKGASVIHSIAASQPEIYIIEVK